MVIFLTSNMDMSEKVNGKFVAHKMNNSNGIVRQLKSSIKDRNKIVFVASNPNSFDITDSFAQNTFDSFHLEKMDFDSYFVLDNRNKDRAREVVKGASVLFLAGGHVPTQNKFFEDIKLKSLLKDFDGVIIGQSAGSMNLAKKVYNYPEDVDELDDPKYLKGLGLTNLTIVPHFNEVTGNEQVDERINLMQDYLLPDSKKTPLVCIKNGTHIRIENGKVELCGETWLIENGVLTKVCSNRRTKEYEQ